jgi:hypothetical protein
MNIYQVTKKLIGSIEPIGETNTDNRRYENLDIHIYTVEKLLYDLTELSFERNRHEHSIKKAGERAYKYIKSLAEELKEYIDE